MNHEPLPPHDLDAERSVLGCMILDGEAIDVVRQTIGPEMFYLDSHRLICEAAMRLHDAGGAVDVVTLASELEARGQLEQAGGTTNISTAMETVQHIAHADHYAGIVREKWLRRQVRDAATETLQDIHHLPDTPQAIAARCETRLHSIIATGAGCEPVTLADAVSQWEVNRAAGPGRVLSTGWPDVNKLLRGGLRPGQLVIVAARPSMGKTALAVCLARHVARNDLPAMLVSLEMPRHELTGRLLSLESGVSAAVIDSGDLSADAGRKLADAADRLPAWPLVIDDAATRTVAQVAAAARLQKRRRGLSLLVVDYLQLLSPEDRRVNREQQVATMSRGLKALALDLEIPVLCLSQLNRAVEQRDNRRPRLSDLRESGAIEQDADAVLFINRPAVYDRNADPSEAELIIAKHRNGPTGIARLHWDGATMAFHSAAPGYAEPTF